jgi:hypothetical protein
MTYSQNVINANYPLLPKYKNLFLADNNVNNTEVIFPIVYDANHIQTYGGTTFLVNSSISGAWAETPSFYGVPHGGWSGNRATQNILAFFPDTTGKTDQRPIFRITEKVCDTLGSFTSGVNVTKFKNVTSAGVTLTDASGTFCSTDMPIFRSAEMYLTYAEAAFRSTGSATGQALTYYNTVRQRAYNGSSTSGTVSTFTLTDLLNERGRELYWEGFRRTDLIRFGEFVSGDFTWPFKGGSVAGSSLNSNLNIFPLPAADVIANPNLKQNPGY